MSVRIVADVAVELLGRADRARRIRVASTMPATMVVMMVVVVMAMAMAVVIAVRIAIASTEWIARRRWHIWVIVDGSDAVDVLDRERVGRVALLSFLFQFPCLRDLQGEMEREGGPRVCRAYVLFLWFRELCPVEGGAVR